MFNKEFLENLNDLLAKGVDHDALADDLGLLEKAHQQLHALLITARMKKLMRDFGERKTDIYVVTFPRSGTTLMQMMLYQMTTDGDMTFPHIYEVSPWCRFSAFFNRPMPSIGERRIIKSHDDYAVLEQVKKGRFIFIIRDGLDAIASLHQQTLDYVDPAASFEELSARNMERWLRYNREWISNRNGLNILYVHYEDLISDKEAMIRRIADFIEVPIDASVLQRVMERTSIEFMKRHETKFGEQPEHWKVYNNFIRNGKTGEGRMKFTQAQRSHLETLARQYEWKGTPLARYLG